MENVDRNKKTAVVLESTVYPGVTRKVLGGLCESLGLNNDVVTLAYCPERVNPGDFERGIESVSQIVGCDNQVVGSLASLFARITNESSTYVGKMEVAEASKLIENVQRDIDIALANELAMVLPRDWDRRGRSTCCSGYKMEFSQTHARDWCWRALHSSGSILLH